MNGRDAKLSREDRILWNRVARTATPLRGRDVPLLSEPEPLIPLEVSVSDASDFRAAMQAHAPKRDHAQHNLLDVPVRNKLSKGRLPIEARIDLHGLTQGRAHSLLLGFLHRAYGEGLRHVLVITGKGSSFGSDGILRRAVPAWFATPPFRGLVGGWDDAARRHGGSGALYVRLRRQGGGRAP
jgi:DNA-nicking Smr family endonuclease